MIRRALESDIAAIARIYNQAITDGSFATSEVEPVTPESRIDWLAQHKDPYPAFVWETKSREVLGWSTLSPFSIRLSYPAIAEVSVYLDQSSRGGVIGKVLLLHLIEAAKQFGFRSLVTLIFEKNTASIRGVMAAGFKKTGSLYEASFLRGQWENDVWLQKDLTES